MANRADFDRLADAVLYKPWPRVGPEVLTAPEPPPAPVRATPPPLPRRAARRPKAERPRRLPELVSAADPIPASPSIPSPSVLASAYGRRGAPPPRAISAIVFLVGLALVVVAMSITALVLFAPASARGLLEG
jgi:hypothetical protein